MCKLDQGLDSNLSFEILDSEATNSLKSYSLAKFQHDGDKRIIQTGREYTIIQISN